MKRLLDLKITRLATLLVGGYIIVSTARNIVNLWSAKDRISQAQRRLGQLQAQNAQLNQEIAQVDQPAFIERQARDKLGLVREGEVILVLPQEQINQMAESLRDQYAKSTQPPPEISTWQKWLKLFTD